MIVASSRDGYITDKNNPDPTSWTSKEDQAFFSNMLNQYTFLIIGRKTYEANKGTPRPGRLRVVLTHHPEHFTSETVAGQLEFINTSPTELVGKYQNAHDKALLVGGGYIFEEFLESGLVSEIYHTVEPVILGSGTPMLASGKKLDQLIKLPKPTMTELNDTGTLLYHYVLSN